ncbi:MAG: DNA replication/repair protein RecF [Oscillospiraceae bacterium]|jgi:DNA replication and repair protein RecF|nr:DNA replication/repair protein RecF [Oscillospiraceae bacterium]
MELNELSLRGFRNYTEASAQFVPGVNLIIGSNANGKTNLLEAISYLSTGHGFRTRKEQELIRFGADFAEITAKLRSQEREQELRAVMFAGRRPRQLWLNGVKQKTAAGIYGVLTSVLFCPEDLLILKKGSAPRRKLLDTVISQLRPNYAGALAEYTRIVEQKSALLRDGREHPGMLQILPEYNEQLIRYGALLISYRARYLQALEEAAARFHKEFSGDREELRLHYQTVSTVRDPFAPVEVLRQWLAEHLQSHSHAELESGSCLSGPHKDDFTAELNGLSMAAFASQGQTRTATISIKLAERELMKRDSGEEPLLLLDDVLSELDAGRQDFVLNQLKYGQIFITCCETDRWTALGKVLQVENGNFL